MIMQSVLLEIRAVIAERASGWSRLLAAGKQAAVDRSKDETLKTAAERITGEYAGEFSTETANERAQFRAGVLLGLAGKDMVEIKPASSRAASVEKKACDVTTWHDAQAACADIRAMNDMSTSGRKGTGARTPAAAVKAGPVFPGVTTVSMPAPALILTPLADRWDDFGSDVKAALADEKLRTQLFAILKSQGFTVKPTKAMIEAKILATPAPAAKPRAAALIKAANPDAVLN